MLCQIVKDSFLVSNIYLEKDTSVLCLTAVQVDSSTLTLEEINFDDACIQDYSGENRSLNDSSLIHVICPYV